MQHLLKTRTAVMKLFSLLALCTAVLTLEAKAGVDSYEIYLNKKLILKQSALQPLSLKNLHLDEANYNDNLIIFYSQCNAPDKVGNRRSLTIKDSKGRVVKEWKFADAGGKDIGMVIPVKELLPLAGKNKGELLGFYYTAQGRSEGRLLTSLQIEGGRYSISLRHEISHYSLT